MSTLPCKIDADCGYLRYCSNNRCLHQPEFFDPVPEFLVYLLSALIVGTAKSGGIGGGIVKVPLYQLMLQMTTKESTYATYPLLVGAGFANFGAIIFQKHPTQKRPVIDYFVGLLGVPPILIGTQIGTFLQSVLPEFVLMMLLFTFLLIILPGIVKNFKVYWDKHKQEQLHINKIQAQSTQIKAETQNTKTELTQKRGTLPPISGQLPIESKNTVETKVAIETDKFVEEQNFDDALAQESELAKSYRQQEADQFQLTRLLIIVVFFICSILLNLIRGGRSGKSLVGATLCGTAWWLLYFLYMVIYISLTIGIMVYLIKREKKKRECGFVYLPYDFKFDIRFCLGIIGICFGAGLLTSTLAVGSGLVMVPLFLYFKFHPRLAGAQSGFLIIWLSLNSMVIALNEGLIPMSMLITENIVGIIGVIVFGNITYYYMIKYKLHFLIHMIVVFSVVMNIFGSLYYVTDKSAKYGFSSLIATGKFC